MIKIIFNGINGRIGNTMKEITKDSTDYKIVAGVDKFITDDNSIPQYQSIFDVKENADVIIDFSVPDSIEDTLKYAVENNLKLVIATTGHNDQQLEEIHKASEKITIFKASNMSIGIAMLESIAKHTACVLGTDYDVEIIEEHHNKKYDSPSGTALTLANAINEVRNNEDKYVYGRHNTHERRTKNEIGIHSIRGGNIVGKHEILFIGGSEIITITHEAQNREVFVNGALRAASFILDKPNGLYNMQDLVNAENNL